MTLNTSKNTLSLANTKIVDLEHLKTTQPISATHTYELFSSLQRLHLLQMKIWNQYKQNPIQHLDQSLNSLAISELFEKLLDENFVSRFLKHYNSLSKYI